MEQLITFLKQLSPELSKEDIDYFLSHWTIQKQLKQKEYLLVEGETEKNMYFVLKGTFRIYFTSTSIKEGCDVLVYPINFCNEYLSFTTIMCRP